MATLSCDLSVSLLIFLPLSQVKSKVLAKQTESILTSSVNLECHLVLWNRMSATA